MEFLYNFSALIQLVAAINFAYIVCKFNEKFDSVISNAGSNIQKSFDKISAKINLDTMTLKSKSASVQAEGLDCTAFIGKLTNSLTDIESFKNQKQTQIQNVISIFVNKEGYCSLFLFLSLYTVIDLGLVAWISVSDNWNVSLFLYIDNLLSLIYSICLFAYSTFASGKQSNKASIIAFVCILLISAIFVWINSKVQNIIPMNPAWEFSLSLISIVLPFLAIGFVSLLLTFVNVWALVYSLVIHNKTNKQRKQITKELKKLDTALEVINPDGVSFQ